MARSELNTVTYFPLYCDEGKKMFYIEETYGNDGFAAFIKILRELAKTDYHYLDLSKSTSLMFLSAKCKVGKELLSSIISDLVELGKFDKELWDSAKVIWCQDFIDSIQDAYKKRNNNCIDRKSLLELLYSKGILIRPKSNPKQPKVPSQGVDNTQIKEKDIKEEENKEELFESLWKLYPTKAGKDIALKSFLKLTTVETERVKMVLPIFSKTKEFEKYNHPHLSTYLNQKRFNDEIIGNTTQSERKLLRLPSEYENYMGMELGLLLSRVKTQKGIDYIPDISKAQFDSLPRDSFNMYESLIKSGNCKIIEE